jgi:hypothetical protein
MPPRATAPASWPASCGPAGAVPRPPAGGGLAAAHRLARAHQRRGRGRRRAPGPPRLCAGPVCRAPACRRPRRATSSRNTCARKACLKSSWTPWWPAMWRCLPPAWARRRGAGAGQGQQASTPWPWWAPPPCRQGHCRGRDILVAQGHDAGGHTGPIGTFSWCRRSWPGRPGVRPGDVPLAALAAARRWPRPGPGRAGCLAGHAVAGHARARPAPELAAKLMAAGSDDTVITRAHSGKPCRVVRSAFSRRLGRARCPRAAGHALPAGADRRAAGGGGRTRHWRRCCTRPLARAWPGCARSSRSPR